jgi:hypothetical protein
MLFGIDKERANSHEGLHILEGVFDLCLVAIGLHYLLSNVEPNACAGGSLRSPFAAHKFTKQLFNLRWF